jgi:hypothetical protein
MINNDFIEPEIFEKKRLIVHASSISQGIWSFKAVDAVGPGLGC